MCDMRHRLRTFSFRRKIMLRSQDIQVFVFLTIIIYQIFEFMMSTGI